MTDPSETGSGAAGDAAPPGKAAPRPDPDHPSHSGLRAAVRPSAGPVRIRLNAQIRRRLRLRPRQALAPLRTAMWAACPLA